MGPQMSWEKDWTTTAVNEEGDWWREGRLSLIKKGRSTYTVPARSLYLHIACPSPSWSTWAPEGRRTPRRQCR